MYRFNRTFQDLNLRIQEDGLAGHRPPPDPAARGSGQSSTPADRAHRNAPAIRHGPPGIRRCASRSRSTQQLHPDGAQGARLCFTTQNSHRRHNRHGNPKPYPASTVISIINVLLLLLSISYPWIYRYYRYANFRSTQIFQTPWIHIDPIQLCIGVWYSGT